MLILGSSIIIGLFLLGTTIGKSILDYKAMDRTVVVKGLAQKEVNADIVIWPITYLRASNNLSELYKSLDNDTEAIKKLKSELGFPVTDALIHSPNILVNMVLNAFPKLEAKLDVSSQ